VISKAYSGAFIGDWGPQVDVTLSRIHAA
jgi:hypothetical protein